MCYEHLFSKLDALCVSFPFHFPSIKSKLLKNFYFLFLVMECKLKILFLIEFLVGFSFAVLFLSSSVLWEIQSKIYMIT